MDSLLAWPSLVFYVPVAFGAVLALGAALGGIGDGPGHAGGTDGAADDGPGEGDSADAWSLLALGRLPLALRLMLLSLTFGGIGLVLGPLVHAVFPGPRAIAALVTIAVAGVGALGISGAAARLFARRVPLFESETIRRAELVGTTGHLVLPVVGQASVVQVHDRRGNLHQLRCRFERDEDGLPAGTEVLLTDYDERAFTFVATRSPLV